MSGDSSARTYRSPLRQHQAARTRAAVLAAARTLFAVNGWVGTSVRDVAREAGVSVETVYATVGTKAQTLIAALDVAVVGDDVPVALEDRPEFAALGRADTLGGRSVAAARLVAALNERAWQLDQALRQGAVVEEVLAERLAELDRGRLEGVAAGGGLVAGRALSAAERDEMSMLVSIDIYRILVRERGWGRSGYETWLAARIEELLTRPV